MQEFNMREVLLAFATKPLDAMPYLFTVIFTEYLFTGNIHIIRVNIGMNLEIKFTKNNHFF